MSKFVIECPSCGKYAQAKTGFFTRKKIDCTCGYTIHTKLDRLSSRECAHCKNMVVFDQSKDEKALCPVCKEPINTQALKNKTIEFSCVQCGIRLHTSKTATNYTCPVCECENNVAERIKFEEIKHSGLASIIKYEGDNETLVWKHPIEDFNLGSQLIVHESQEAIFFKDGQALDLFGSGRYTLETQQLPMLEKLYKMPTDTEGTFHSEVYYINQATQMGIKWGTDSKIRLFDPHSGMYLEIGAGGEFSVRVINSRKLLLKLVGTMPSMKNDELLGLNSNKAYFRAMVMTQVKSYLASVIKENKINILEIDEQLLVLSSALREKINEALADYGLTMPEFFVSRIVTPDDDPSFRKMKEQYAQEYLLIRQEKIRKKEAEAIQERKRIEAQTDAQLKLIDAQAQAEAIKMEAQGDAEAYRLKAEAEALEMKMKGYTYTQETSRMVGMEAMQNGIAGGSEGTGGMLGDITSLGVTLGALGGVMGITKEAVSPAFEGIGIASNPAPQEKATENTWDCSCGNKVTGNFCNNCGAKKPTIDTWNCACGTKVTGNFCNNCGAKKTEKTSWDCTCGKTDIEGNFCNNCGKRKGE